MTATSSSKSKRKVIVMKRTDSATTSQYSSTAPEIPVTVPEAVEDDLESLPDLEGQDDPMMGMLPREMMSDKAEVCRPRSRSSADGDDTDSGQLPPLLQCQATQTTPVPYLSPPSSSMITVPEAVFKDTKDPNAVHGSCGFKNLGNTCFMNSGLQCLVSNSFLVNFFTEHYQESQIARDTPTLTNHFCKILYKVWCGQYSVLHPNEFKDTLGQYYPQFNNFRQHDCQEFLALMLDNLHEQLNQAPKSVQNNILVLPPSESQQTALPISASMQEYREDAAGSDITDDGQSDITASSVVQSELDDGERSLIHSEATSPLEGIHQVTLNSEDSNHSAISTGSNRAPLSRSLGNCSPFSPIASSDNCDLTSQEDEVGACGGMSQADDSNHFMCNKINKWSGEKNLLSNNQASGPIRLPSIEDYYRKDTKTKNTNVLVTEFEQEEAVMTDSEKFSKPDNITVEQSLNENLNDLASYSGQVEKDCSKSFKCNNLFNDMKRDLDSKNDLITPDYSINNVKRIRMDEEEKIIRLRAQQNVNVAVNPTKQCDDIVMEVNDGEVDGTGGDMSAPQLVIQDAYSLHDEFQATIEEELEAEKTWNKYLQTNSSIIVDTFQGQFKSMVVCLECHHVSVTYEPFMYLSLPLPHAMERQISVIYVPWENKQPVRYLVTLNKTDNMRKLKDEIIRYVMPDGNGDEAEPPQLIIAEVLHNHIARILEDHTLIRFINDYNRTVYAYQMVEAPFVGQTTTVVDQSPPTETPVAACSATHHQQQKDIFTEIEDFEEHFTCSNQSDIHVDASITASHCTSLNEYDNVSCCNESIGSKSLSHNGQSDKLGIGSWQKNFDQGKKDAVNSWLITSMAETGVTQTASVYSEVDDSHQQIRSDQVPTKLVEDPQGLETCSGAALPDTKLKDEPIVIGTNASGWKACAVCLEEMIDANLLVHTSCGGTLCHHCLERTYKHYGQGYEMCPVCSINIDVSVDFIPFNQMSTFKPKAKVIAVPVLYRHEQNGEEQTKTGLIGHPNILYLPNVLPGHHLYQAVDRVVPFITDYTIVLTDAQGYNCSRCLFTQHCKGCQVSRDSEIILQPSDHLTVCFTDLPKDQLATANTHIDHRSMEKLRPNQPLTLFDCFEAFTESEILDAQNPWYCPECKKNQCARKTMTVWRYPETLIVYLKRFVFHDLVGTKLDNKVVFPYENLDLSHLVSGPSAHNDLFYDLQACVCHFGGVNSGHYTSYAKHSNSGQWYYYNDDTATIKAPSDEDYNDAYILFYHKQGSERSFSYPENPCPEEENDVTLSQSSSYMYSTPLHTISHDAVSKALENIGNIPNITDDHPMPFAELKLDFNIQ